MGIGRRLRILRESNGLTQEQLAAKLDITPSAVGNYERDLSFPRGETMFRLFEVLGCEPNELFRDCYRKQKNEVESHLDMYRELDRHGRELVDACTEIEYRRCKEESGLTAVAARSFGKNETPAKLRLEKREGAGSIFDEPDYKE